MSGNQEYKGDKRCNDGKAAKGIVSLSPGVGFTGFWLRLDVSWTRIRGTVIGAGIGVFRLVGILKFYW